MSRLEEILNSYQEYHTEKITRITHFIGIPLIIFSIILFLSWFSFSLNPIISIPLVWFAIIILTIYYMKIDRLIGVILAVFFIILALIAGISGHYEVGKSSFITFLITFIGGWLIQLIGHFFEKRKPAFMDNFMQIFAAPIFLCAEVLIKFGIRKELGKYLKKSEQANEINNN